jgi:hypothetical protein
MGRAEAYIIYIGIVKSVLSTTREGNRDQGRHGRLEKTWEGRYFWIKGVVLYKELGVLVGR